MDDASANCDRICGFLRASILDEHVEVAPESRLSDLGVDSVSLVEILLFVERQFGVMLPERDLTRENLETPEALSRCIFEFKSSRVP